ncbi:adenine deaminase C-terminal domain-containing protein [Metabacillus sediminilitoris]|uniref:adenine deaminase n=1 Tax=Metabacillus sediminilitoris TaxID=2567941 RepID=A0A4S4BKP7_9BACI|nr:adenine deaminase C-terminal domain-containing protein [Metabacillus sediminilitoris]QGQ46547.1 amidohydrolase family protein [Metabacillus sediminilitoris]THF75314.1 adenine deaminase [Metabacillus sediminilitoris]
MKLRASRKELIDVAKGLKPADIYIKGGKVVNVYSGEYLEQNIAIYKDCIAYVGDSELSIGDNTQIIDAEEMYISPGFIESHAHPWVIYNPISVTEKVLPLGTTTTVNDNLFFYLHMGVQGLKELIKDSNLLPGHFLWLVRLVSQADYPGEKEWFHPENIRTLLDLDEVVGSAEITRWPLLYNGDPFVLDMIDYVKQIGKIADGHNAGCSYEKLNSIAASGINACHEAITAKEAYDRLRLGLWTVLRNSSLRPDLHEIIKLLTEGKVSTSRIIMTTDGPHPSFIDEEGFVDGLVRKAVQLGVPAIQAIQMVTINPATYLRLDEYIGGIAPGRQADILLLPNLSDFKPELVISKGQIVAKNGKLTTNLPVFNWEKYMVRKPFSISKSVLENRDLYRYPHQANNKHIPVAHFMSTVISKRVDTPLPSINGYADLSQHEDLIQAALIDREGNWVTRGILQNFAPKLDGMASTYNTTTELLTMGRDPNAMAIAAARVYEMGGGIAIVDGDKIVLEIPLPLTGMMTTSSSFDQATKYQNSFLNAMKERGYPFHDILYSLLFLTCDFLPGLRLIPHGLYEVKTDTILNPAGPLPSVRV